MARSRASTSIKPEPNKFDDHFLDVIGNAFKFDHPKGLAEWLKNSADAYSTSGVRDDEQFILLRFDIRQPKSQSIFECIDFVGCSKKDIDEALKVWGSPTAAKHGTSVATYGGHGNGGKFYMRQMFQEARMITFRGGVLNVFGFDSSHRYGFAKGYVDRPMSLPDALDFAEIDDLEVPGEIRARWKKSKKNVGFTVVRGERPQRFSGRSTIDTILDGLKLHPQARRLLKRKPVIVVRRGSPWGNRLVAPEVSPRPGFELPREILLPKHFQNGDERVSTKSATQPKPKLILRTSEQPLTSSRELSTLNTIDILGEVGCIGSYRMNEIGVMRNASDCEFIYGECECAFLEDPQFDCVSNDREKLVSTDLTQEILQWVRERVESFAGEIAERRRSEQAIRDLAQSSLFNQILDRWKNKFLSKITRELFGGASIGDAFGGAGGGASGSGTAATNGNQGSDTGESDQQRSGDGDDAGNNAGHQGGSGDERRQSFSYPTVLLSGFDPDPLMPESGESVVCDPRHPPVHQRVIDIEHHIYWINTARPLARRILDEYSSESPRWRDYLFQRHVEIILKQLIYKSQKDNADFSAESVDRLIGDVTGRVHDAAAQELDGFLFDDNLRGSVPSFGRMRTDEQGVTSDD